MPHQAELPNCSVAIKNSGRITIKRTYARQEWSFEKGGKITVLPFALAHHFFGFELDDKGRMYRNTDEKYSDADHDTAYYAARASFLPWSWITNEKLSNKVYNPLDPPEKQITYGDMFELIRDTWENKITGKLMNLPREITESQFEALPV
jgi:hypothetical protein